MFSVSNKTILKELFERIIYFFRFKFSFFDADLTIYCFMNPLTLGNYFTKILIILTNYRNCY